MPSTLLLGYAGEAILALLGLRLLWIHVASPSARAAPAPARLSLWPGTGSDFLLLLLFVIGGAIG